MSKAVLVMDMPENCKNCCFCRGLNACKLNKYLNGHTMTTIYTVDKQVIDGTRPYWCPLSELPEKIPEQKSGFEDVRTAMHRDGRNACIDEIGGGDNE